MDIAAGSPLLITIAALLASPCLGQATFTPLGDLPGGRFSSTGGALSADGLTTGGDSESDMGQQACIRAGGVLMALPGLSAGGRGGVTGLNADATRAVGYAFDGVADRAVLWVGGLISVLPQVPGHSGGAVAQGISADGRVIAAYNTNGQLSSYTSVRGVRIVDGVAQELPPSAGSSDSAASGGPSADGRIIAGRVRDGGRYVACFWTDTTLTMLPFLPGPNDYSQAFNTSADGLVLVGVSRSARASQNGLEGEACLWRANQPLGLGDLPGGTFASVGFGCTHDGSVVVGYGNTDAGAEAFIWDQARGMRRLKDVLVNDLGLTQVASWTLTVAYGITPDGTAISGAGLNSAGDPEGWTVHLPAACRVDFNGDGSVNVQDFLAFLASFAGTDPRADFTGDGQINVSDFLAFLAAFAAGC
jgi:uncharacterized membrane protein